MKYQIIEIRNIRKEDKYSVFNMLVRCLDGGIFVNANDLMIVNEVLTDKQLSRLEIKEGRVYRGSDLWSSTDTK